MGYIDTQAHHTRSRRVNILVLCAACLCSSDIVYFKTNNEQSLVIATRYVCTIFLIKYTFYKIECSFVTFESNI